MPNIGYGARPGSKTCGFTTSVIPYAALNGVPLPVVSRLLG